MGSREGSVWPLDFYEEYFGGFEGFGIGFARRRWVMVSFFRGTVAGLTLGLVERFVM